MARQSADVDAWASALTLPLLYFFRRRVVDETTARADAQASLKGFQLVPLNPEILGSSLVSAGPDFEDNIQLAGAESIAAIHLITRNKKDFQSSSMPVLTPEDWMALGEIAKLEADLPNSFLYAQLLISVSCCSVRSKFVEPHGKPVGRNPEQEPPAKAGARVEGSRC